MIMFGRVDAALTLVPFFILYYVVLSRRTTFFQPAQIQFMVFIITLTFAQSLMSILSYAHRINIAVFYFYLPFEFALLSFLALRLTNIKATLSLPAAVFFGSSCYLITFYYKDSTLIPTMMLIYEGSVLIILILMAMDRLSYYSDKIILKGVLLYSITAFMFGITLQAKFYEAFITHSILNMSAKYLFTKALIHLRGVA
ncbi:MAG: hypothetical protein HYS25_01010 [Ignavibacteriales bacterium]|nr:hypothetical protein [Ignavibacteriales bacterium]